MGRSSGPGPGSCLILLVFSWCLYSTSPNPYHRIPIRFCGTDFTTPGSCYILQDTSRSWERADQYCRQNLTLEGYLGRISDQHSQDLVATEVEKRGWPVMWINGRRRARVWNWFTRWRDLAFQGCWIDNPSNRDLPVVMDNITKPSECIDTCKARRYERAGVQLDQSRRLLCFCGRYHGKHGQSHSGGCDTDCPGRSSDSEVINQKCGGTRFHHFAPTPLRRNELCVAYDHRLNHAWAEQRCNLKAGYICDHDKNTKLHCESNVGLIWADGICISLHEEGKTYFEAFYSCQRYLSRLVMVTNGSINRGILKNLDPNISYYFGLTSEFLMDSKWKLVTSYLNFGSNQLATGVGQDCFAMISANNFTWSTLNCGAEYPFICQIDIKEPEEATTTLMTTPSAREDNKRGSTTKSIALTHKQGLTTTSTDLTDADVCDAPCRLVLRLEGAGIGAGAMLLLVLIILAIYCLIRRCTTTSDQESNRTQGNSVSSAHTGQSDSRNREPHLPDSSNLRPLPEPAGRGEHPYEPLQKPKDKHYYKTIDEQAHNKKGNKDSYDYINNANYLEMLP